MNEILNFTNAIKPMEITSIKSEWKQKNSNNWCGIFCRLTPELWSLQWTRWCWCWWRPPISGAVGGTPSSVCPCWRCCVWWDWWYSWRPWGLYFTTTDKFRGKSYWPRGKTFRPRGKKYWPRDKTYGPRGKKYRPRDRKYWSRDKKYRIRDSAMSYLWPLIQRQKVLTHIFDHWYTQWLTHTCYNYSDRKYCPISVLTH